MRQTIFIGILAFFLISPRQSHACDEASIIIGALGVAALGLTTLVYPPVTLENMLTEQSPLQRCIQSSVFLDQDKRKAMNEWLDMAHMAFVVSAATNSAAILSGLIARMSNEKYRTVSDIASGIAIATFLAGLGSETAGVIQTQRFKNELTQDYVKVCPGDQSDDLTHVLGFGYFDLFIQGTAVLGALGALMVNMLPYIEQ